MATMNYRKLLPEIEQQIIQDRQNNIANPYRALDENAIRRNMERDKNNVLRPSYARDIDKILHLPLYNRYNDKTQVFSLYHNDDITRRGLHVQLVSRIARNIGRLLFDQKNDMLAAMPTPVRVFYGSHGYGDCPLTVREGRNWLSRTFPEEPEVKSIPVEVTGEEIAEPALSMKELWFRYEKDSPDILRGVSAEVPTGSLYAIVGGNGAGKSTTLKAICGICRPYRGKVKIFGKPVEKYKSSELFGGILAMLPQDPKSLFVKKTVREDLEEMTRDKTLIDETAATCQIESLLGSHPYDLSGGEQQRAALAKVLLTQPKLLLLDEPTKGIDSFFKETLAKILCKLKEQGVTIVMVSHDVEFCARYADLVSMFFDGQILTTDTPRRFFGANSFYTTAANRMSRHVFRNAVTAEDVVLLYKKNKGEE
mgnify:CR=1 FL=1